MDVAVRVEVKVASVVCYVTVEVMVSRVGVTVDVAVSRVGFAVKVTVVVIVVNIARNVACRTIDTT